MVFMPLVVIWIGQFCCDVIGRHVIGRHAVIGRLLFCCCFLSIYCLLRCVSFVWGHVWVVCKVHAAVGINSGLCTSYLMSAVVGSLCCIKVTHSHVIFRKIFSNTWTVSRTNDIIILVKGYRYCRRYSCMPPTLYGNDDRVWNLHNISKYSFMTMSNFNDFTSHLKLLTQN